METLMAQTTGDTHTRDFKGAQPATAHTLSAHVRARVYTSVLKRGELTH